MTPQIAKNMSVLVISCDRYADLWPVFFAIFRKYWPDCPYPIYLGSNRLSFPDAEVNPVLTQEDPNWSWSARCMIEQVPAGHLLVLLEDFFLFRPVDTGRIEQSLQAVRELGAGYLRLKPFPRPDRKVPGYPLIGEIERGAPYRCSLQAAIWRKDTLLSLLKDGETAWDLEEKGATRSNALSEGFCSTWRPVLHYTAGVTFGKWLPHVLDKCRREGAPVDLTKRQVMTRAEHLDWMRRVAQSSVANRVPWKTRRKLGNVLRRMGLLSPRTVN